MTTDTSGWSGEGEFTTLLVSALQQVPEVAAIRVEDAPASRAGEGYNLLANEVFVGFATEPRRLRARWLGLVPVFRTREVPRLTLAGLDDRLALRGDIGPADYRDDGMLQYLRTQRIVAPHQARGYKLVELVRVYAVPEKG